jgi:NitT/TauT family transport system substrate-binding protein
MIRRCLAPLILIAALVSPAAAQERVSVATTRDVANGALFLAAARGYFKAEGLDLEMTAYPSDMDVAQAVAAGANEFGLAKFTTESFAFAGRGLIKAIAAQASEKRNYEGNELIVSNAAFANGLRKPEQLVDRSAAIGALGSTSHYQFGRIADVKGFDFASITLKPQSSLEAIAHAVASGQADAAILPSDYARALLTSDQAKLLAWFSQIDEQELGALFASAETIRGKRGTVEKFLRAYRRGAAAYYDALMRHDKYGKRISSAGSLAAADDIARYVYPGRAAGGSTVEEQAYFIDPHAHLDAADVARQMRWYQAQGLVDKEFDAGAVIDESFK